MAAKHEMDLADHEAVENNFKYHLPHPANVQKFINIREWAHGFAVLLLESVPVCAERTEVLKKIDEAVMWANAGIARNQ
jgi:hypothetical protein